MPSVRMPDGTLVNFPDDMPPDQVKGLISQKFPEAVPNQMESKPEQTSPQPSLMDQLKRQAGLTGRYLVEGVTSVPNMLIGDPLAASINYATGKNIPLPSQLVSQDLTSLGFPEPQGPLEEIVGAGSRALAGTGGVIKAGEAIASKAIAPITRAVGSAMAQAPLTQAASAIGSGLSGEAAYQSGAGPFGQLGASLVGGFAGGKIGSKIENPAMARPTAEQIREGASNLYRKAEQVGGNLRSTTTDKFLDDIATISHKDEVARALGGKDFIAENSDIFESMRGQPMTLDRASAIDQRLTELLDNETILGKPTQNGRQILLAQSKLRNIIDNASPDDVEGGVEGFYALKQARKEWSKAARLRDIEAIIQKANGMEQPATGLRTGFRTLLNNPNRMRGYTPQEAKAIADAAKTGIVGNMFRVFGSGLVPIGAGVAGATGGPLGSIVSGTAGYGIQQGSKAIGQAMQMAKANKAADLVAGGANQIDPQYLAKILGITIGAEQ